jgi:hypothetical protein
LRIGLKPEKGISKRDEIEPLPPGVKGFWISSPSNIIHLIHQWVVISLASDYQETWPGNLVFFIKGVLLWVK